MQSAPESIWVQKAARGDAEAFARLVDAYWEPVRRWLYGMTGKEHLAEDAAQDAFLKAWTNLPTLRDQATFRVWLFQIARHCWADARRRSKSYKRLPLPPEIPGNEPGPLGALIGAEAREQLQMCLEQLPSKYRAAYLLWTQQELPYEEIAAILGISEETARWRVCKARQGLVEMMSPYLNCH